MRMLGNDMYQNMVCELIEKDDGNAGHKFENKKKLREFELMSNVKGRESVYSEKVVRAPHSLAVFV